MPEGLLTSCQNNEGALVDHGSKFHPKPEDYCYECLCHNGTEQMCLSPACGEPPCKKFEKVHRTCCSFVCTNTTLSGPDALSTAGIRLAVSTATCILIVAIILLLMHKLRRHRLFLNIRQGFRGQHGDSSTAVGYTSAHDEVNIDISYEPLHIPGAPPPYSPTSDNVGLPPAYSSIVDRSSSTEPLAEYGATNTGCQTTPPQSVHNITTQANSSNNCEKSGANPNLTPPDFQNMRLIERTSGVGASNTDLTLRVDLGDSCKDLCDQIPSARCKPSNTRTSEIPKANMPDARLPVRLEPVGGEAGVSSTTASSSPLRYQGATDSCDAAGTSGAVSQKSYREKTNMRSKSAGSSPTVPRHKSLTLTQYGFIDDGSISDLLEKNGTVIGLGEEELFDIAANKPDRLNARVRRQNRIKRNSKPMPSSHNLQ
ncbi:uncharacterized protein [Watersipora subatra]|uniref:uncharacterized protein isoform X1 n=1 Tax=Watersipora subatra TaxID=2589382 RepID=UPI00355BA374